MKRKTQMKQMVSGWKLMLAAPLLIGLWGCGGAPAPKQAGPARNPIDPVLAARPGRGGPRPSPAADQVTPLRRGPQLFPLCLDARFLGSRDLRR